MSVLFISAELEEVLRLSHKVAVLRDRELVAELANDEGLTLDTLVHDAIAGEAARMSGLVQAPPVLARAVRSPPLLVTDLFVATDVLPRRDARRATSTAA